MLWCYVFTSTDRRLQGTLDFLLSRQLPQTRTLSIHLHPFRSDAATMSIFSYIRSIYALDTIDTRFTSSSATPYKTVVDARPDPTSPHSKKDGPPQGVPVRLDGSGRPIAQPSRWNTPEFYFYYLVFIVVVPYMFYITYDVSRRSCYDNPVCP